MGEMIEGCLWEKMAAAGPKEAEKYNLKRVVTMLGQQYDEVAN